MTVPTPNIAVYTENLVVTPATLASLKQWAEAQPPGKTRDMYLTDLGNANLAADIAKAGFDTIIVGLFHVHEGGEIYYNDFPVTTETFPDIYAGIAALKTTPGSTVKTVLLSFGGGNWEGHPASVSDSDYPNMKRNWPSFRSDLRILMDQSRADGVDWDYEPETIPFDVDFIVKITNEVAAWPRLVTAAPYTDQSNWIAVIEGTRKGNAGSNFAWWNLQAYASADYGDWVGAVKNATGMSPQAAQAFVLPGYKPYDCSDSPAGAVRELRAAYPSLNGAFIWFYTTIKDCAGEMAASIRRVF